MSPVRQPSHSRSRFTTRLSSHNNFPFQIHRHTVYPFLYLVIYVDGGPMMLPARSARYIFFHFIVTFVTGSNSNSLSLSSKTARTTEYEQRSCPLVKGLHANLIRFITQEGFHRDLDDTVEVTVTTSPIPIKYFTSGECLLGLLHDLSKDVFVDPYEILRDPRLSEHIRVLNNWTDLESPAWLTKSNSTVFMQLKTILTGNLISTEPMPLPIHYRYQLPRGHSMQNRVRAPGSPPPASGILNPAGYVAVTLPLPEIIMRCDHWDSALVEEQCKTASVICNRKSDKNSNCLWVLLPYKSNLKSGTIFIPVGDSDSTFLITSVTIGVVLCGMLFLLVTLFRAKNRLLTESQNASNATAHPHLD